MSTILPPRSLCGNLSGTSTPESSSTPSPGVPPDHQVDRREQIYNEGLTGPISHVQRSPAEITRLRGIMFDVDPHLIRPGGLFSTVPIDPREFYPIIIGPMLDRHPVLSKAQVRISGNGLHVLLLVEPPIELRSAADQQRWAEIVKVVQASLPIDPDQPGITAVTRPVGSINGKNRAMVEMLVAGVPVTEQEVLKLYDEMSHAPFETVCKILTGKTKVSPCPICHQPGSTLSALNWVGNCYSHCGDVSLAQLYDTVLAPREVVDTEATRDATNKS